MLYNEASSAVVSRH